MKTKQEATARPWVTHDATACNSVEIHPDTEEGENGEHIIAECPLEGSNESREIAEANAALIVRAVNAHEALKEALTLALPYVETALEDQGYKPGAVDRMVRQIRDALALAEGKP